MGKNIGGLGRLNTRGMNVMSSPRRRVIIAAAWFFDEAVVTIIVAAFEAVAIPGDFSVASFATFATIIPIPGGFGIASFDTFATLATSIIATTPLIATTSSDSLGLPSILPQPPKILCVHSRQRAQTRLLIITHITIIT